MAAGAEGGAGAGRFCTGVVWALLLVGFWLWGGEAAEVPGGAAGPTTGDVAAVGRPARLELPPTQQALSAAPPQHLDIPSIRVSAPVVRRGLDADGAVAPPGYDKPGVVGWYEGGTAPGAEGTALFVGHVDTDTRPAVFYHLSTLRPGAKARVTRADGTVAEFTVEGVRVFGRNEFDARQAYGERQPGRAELRLITCGGTFDRVTRSYSSNVVVSAYLTGTAP
ncbi:class F sortase [Streptomyces sp. NPDC002851]